MSDDCASVAIFCIEQKEFGLEKHIQQLAGSIINDVSCFGDWWEGCHQSKISIEHSRTHWMKNFLCHSLMNVPMKRNIIKRARKTFFFRFSLWFDIQFNLFTGFYWLTIGCFLNLLSCSVALGQGRDFICLSGIHCMTLMCRGWKWFPYNCVARN